jgi:flagellar biosynthesis protein
MEAEQKAANAIKKAVALRYTEENDAPVVIAKGAGIIAENIVQAATKNSVPIYQSQALTSVLMAVELDREIPPELYKVVAEVLAFVYRMDQKRKPLPTPKTF